jgi:hypothetical protein
MKNCCLTKPGGLFFVIISTGISNDKIQMANGGWGPIEHKTGRIHSFDIWALTLGFNE